jgi:hypothetical protein
MAFASSVLAAMPRSLGRSPPQAFWSCVLCLATASSVLRDRLPGALGPVPRRLAGLVAALELEPAVLAREAEALEMLAMPWHALRSQHLTQDLSVTGQTFYARTAIEGAHPLIPWALNLVAPMALEMGALDMLTELDHGYFGALLIQTPKCRSIWIKAWSRILSDNRERALGLWLRALREQVVTASLNGDWTGEFLRPTFALLHDSQTEAAAKRAVRSGILTWPLPQVAENHHREIFAWAAPHPEDWEAGLIHWKTQPTLSWELLRDCGTPHALLARWALHFLRERESVPHAFRDGPIGIIASPNVRPTQAGQWKAAFQEARECLDWLLEHGDREALHIIGDASLAPHSEDVEYDVPYVYHEEIRIWFSLGQVFWQRVLSREAGRTVLYERLAAGKYIGIHCWPNFDWQWVLDAVSGDQTLINREAAKIFEAYVHFCSINWHPDAVRHERPWENPPPNISVNWHTAMLLLAAWHDLPVLDEWRRVVVRFGDRRSMTDFGPALAGVFTELATRHSAVVKRASPDLPDDLLRAFCADGTRSFWATWLANVGLETFLRRIDGLGLEDLGTGIITALLDSNQTTLAARLTEPRYFTPFLRAARDPAIYRDEHLRRLLWGRPRSVADLAPLFDEPHGPWLDALIELSSTWPSAARRVALTAFARHSTDILVRRVCLVAVSARP